MKEVRVRAPATVSNVVCGFDCLGFALREPFDEVVVRRTTEKGVRISNFGEFDLPVDADQNVAGVALMAMLRAVQADFGLEVEIHKGIKPGSGIGSSAASSCGAVVAANRLLGDRFTDTELVDFAMEGEKIASGEKHADNVAPCIFGGFTLVRSVLPPDIVSIEFPPLFATVIHPQIEIRTSEARAILPKDIPLKTAVRQWSNLGSLVAALAKGDYGLISRSLEDHIIEPVRKHLIPGFNDVKLAAAEAGALGGGISGSGPSVFMLSRRPEIAETVEVAVRGAYEKFGIDFHIYVSEIDPNGVRFL